MSDNEGNETPVEDSLLPPYRVTIRDRPTMSDNEGNEVALLEEIQNEGNEVAPVEKIQNEGNEAAPPVEEIQNEGNEAAPVEEIQNEGNEAPVEEIQNEGNEAAPVEKIQNEGNKAPEEKRPRKRRENKKSLEARAAKKLMADLKAIERKLVEQHAPTIRAEGSSKLKGAVEFLISAVKLCAAAASGVVDLSVDSSNIDAGTGTATSESSRASKKQKTRGSFSKPTSAEISGRKRPDLTWHDRCVGIFLYLHPDVFGTGDIKTRLELAAQTIGVNENTFRQWVSLTDKGAERNIQTWYPLVSGMQWKDVKKRFTAVWLKKFDDIPDSATVAEQLIPYQVVAEKAEAVTVAKNTKSLKHIKTIKRMVRSDAGKARKHPVQTEAVQRFVLDRWHSGDPATRNEVYDELRARDDCAEGTEFYDAYFTHGKQPSLANFLVRCLDRINFIARKDPTTGGCWRCEMRSGFGKR